MVSRRESFLARTVASLVAVGALAGAGSARAEDVPVPGPVIEGSIEKLPAGDATVGEPLWELGIGVAAVRFPDYRGSDQNSAYVLPLPFIAYRGRFLRADRDGARAILFAGRQVVVDLSLSASVPSDSKNNDARRGMPDLPGSFEFGPNLNVELWQSASRTFKLDLRLPVRQAITLQWPPRAIGITFSPNLNLDVRGVGGAWNVGLLAGPVFATARHHEHFYSVAPEFATATRPAYEAPGGYGGWRATAAVSRLLGNAWLGGFVRYDGLQGASFNSSQLVRRESNVTVGFGISWIFATSSQRVRTED